MTLRLPILGPLGLGGRCVIRSLRCQSGPGPQPAQTTSPYSMVSPTGLRMGSLLLAALLLAPGSQGSEPRSRSGQPELPTVQQEDVLPRTEIDLEEQIEELGAFDFERREEAEWRLACAGEPAILPLALACANESPERSLRAMRALAAARIEMTYQELTQSSETRRRAAWRALQYEGLADGDVNLVAFLQTLRGPKYQDFFSDLLLTTVNPELRTAALEHLRISGDRSVTRAVLFAAETDYRASNTALLPWAALCHVGEGYEPVDALLDLEGCTGKGHPAAALLRNSVEFLQEKSAPSSEDVPCHVAIATRPMRIDFEAVCKQALSSDDPMQAAEAIRLWWLAYALRATAARTPKEDPEEAMLGDGAKPKFSLPVLFPKQSTARNGYSWPAWPFNMEDLLRDRRPEVRLTGCEIAGERPDENWTPSLSRRLHDPAEEETVRAAAACALGELLAQGNDEARKSLRLALKRERSGPVLRSVACSLFRWPLADTAAQLRECARRSIDPLTRAHLNVLACEAERRIAAAVHAKSRENAWITPE